MPKMLGSGFNSPSGVLEEMQPDGISLPFGAPIIAH